MQSVFDGMAKGVEADRAMSHPVSQGVIDWSCDVSMQASLSATLGCAKAFSHRTASDDVLTFLAR